MDYGSQREQRPVHDERFEGTVQSNLVSSMASNESLTDLKASDEENSHNNMMMIIATLTWFLLSIITLFIYCCNYWQVLRSRPRRHQPESEAELQQSTLLSLDN